MDEYSIFFMMEGDGFEIKLAPINDETKIIFFDLMSCFGKLENNNLNLNTEQQATSELKLKIAAFVDHYSKEQPVLNGLKHKILNLPDEQYFLILQEYPSNTSARLKLEVYISAINKTGMTEALKSEFENRMEPLNSFLGDFLNKYDIQILRNDRRVVIGNIQKVNRCCRFCKKTKKTGAQFKKIAHAISEGLGNKNIILGDECDECNEFFGNEIEPTLIEYLDIYRATLGINGKGGALKLQYKNGHIKNENGMPVIASTNIEKVSDTEFKIRLESSKKYTPVKLYKALCKITLSTLDEPHITSLDHTIAWLKDLRPQNTTLPKIATIIDHNGFSKQPKIVNYVRKTDSNDIPHIVSEFRIGSLVYVYIIPFSEKDFIDFTESSNYERFWNTFSQFNKVPEWKFTNFDSDKEVTVNETIRIIQAEKNRLLQTDLSHSTIL